MLSQLLIGRKSLIRPSSHWRGDKFGEKCSVINFRMFQNNWNVRDKQNRNKNNRTVKRYPPGLRGKEIGLYFKNLNKGKQDSTIKLTLPPSVLTHVKYNLRSLDEIAKKCNINVPQSRRIKQESLNSTEAHKKQNPEWSNDIEVTDGFTLIPRYAQPNKKITPKVKTEPSTSEDNVPIETEVLNIIPKSEPDSLSADFIPIKKVKSEGLRIKKQLIPKIETELSSAPNKIYIKTEKAEVEIVEEPGTSVAADFIPIKTDEAGKNDGYFSSNNLAEHRMLSLRGGGDYKYGYEDIIKGTFNEKLNESLSKGISINMSNSEINDLSFALYEDFSDILTRNRYKSMLKFREKLPAYKKSKELLDTINNSQVVVISGETGCGKSTQVPQIILDDAILNKRGANVKILVTQPRRIAASSLAARVSDERAEKMGNSVGYAVRLEKFDARPRGSIMFCTTGILLADLEVNQGLTNYSHVILDEVHERDTHIDLSMCMLKQVLAKRKDLKLILMSATLDADRLSSYFGNCPTMHIEGLAYPVKDIYLEEILQMTKFKLPPQAFQQRNMPKWKKHRKKDRNAAAEEMERDIKYKSEISGWLESKKHELDRDVYDTLKDSRIENLSIDLVLQLLMHICKGEPGAILVFLPGIGEITALMRKMKECNAFPSYKYQIYPLHSKLPTLEQHAIFERPPKHIRKIIIATNIAETSITIDDIVYVVDCGKIKMSGLNVEENISTLKIESVSQANLRQRRGRAGRCQAGICYHLLTSYRAEQLPIRLLPELQRSNLLEPVLTIKRLRLGNALDALTMVPDPPDPSTIKSAIKHLQQCGALDDKETLTPLGWHLARLPVHPAAGKLVLLGALFGCLDRAASVAAVWSFKDPFLLIIEKETEIKNIKRKLALGEPSDHVALSEAIIQWEQCGRSSKKSFAYDHFLSNSTLELLSDMKTQLGDNLKNMGFLPSGSVKSSWENRNSNNLSLFKAIVAASLYPNIASVSWKNLNSLRRNASVMVRTAEDGKICIHPSSLMTTPHRYGAAGARLCDKPGANWLVYWLKLRSSDLFLIDVTLVYTLPILFFGELQVTDAEETNPDDCFISISTMKVRCKRETADILFQLRSLLDYVLATKVTSSSDSSTRHNEFEELVLNAVIELITAEDEQAEYLEVDLSESDTSESDYGRNHYR